MMRLSEIRIHPLKSAAALLPDQVELDAFGPRWDRRWMAVDDEGVFLSQRATPRLALVRPRLDDGPLDGGLVLTHDELPPLRVEASRQAVWVRIWDDEVEAVDCGEEAADWLTRALGRPARLVHLPDDGRRPVDPDYAAPDDLVAFADAFPLLLVARASLDDLNARLERPLPMERFRPNLVIDGAEPYAEDRWRRIRIGAVEIDVVKPCARCAITTTDQRTAERGREPLRTLARYRRRGGDVLFAQNGIHRGSGVLRIGDPVDVLEWKEPPRFDGGPSG